MIEVLKQALEALENIMLERNLDSATTIAKNARYGLRQAIEEANTNLMAYMFQHNETGQITFVEIEQIENGWEKGNPRYTKIAPLYTHPPQRTEQNFCPRCGKRTNDIHTCTPPRDNT